MKTKEENFFYTPTELKKMFPKLNLDPIPKEERLRIYKQALVEFTGYGYTGYGYESGLGLCSAIEDATDRLYRDEFVSDYNNKYVFMHKELGLVGIQRYQWEQYANLVEPFCDPTRKKGVEYRKKIDSLCVSRYPELRRLRPKNRDLYWFDTVKIQERLDLLNECIKRVKKAKR